MYHRRNYPRRWRLSRVGHATGGKPLSAPPDIPQPRYFWRRLLAVFADWFIVAALTTVLLLPFLRVDETGLRLSGAPLTFTTCQNVSSVRQEITDLVAPEVIAAATLCEVRPFMINNGRTLTLVYALNQSGNTSTSRSLSLAVDGEGLPVQAIVPQSIATPLLLMILSGLFLARGWQTPGKRLADIRVTGEGCAMCRELRRWGMFVLIGCVTFTISALSTSSLAALAQAPVGMFIAGGLTVFVVFFAMYIWPILRWRGAMPYDRATGFRVERAGR
ncbi:RDD family protein [uncultured Sulfitobacter sp.]|uniref:RDD family protein n=1 Tax=uncultured Sulfitobacter sp. TaxID=191468 RepID=UPI003459F5D5